MGWYRLGGECGEFSAIAWGSHPTNVQVAEVRTDEELLLRLSGVGAVWVDAPLTQGEGPFRACDRALHGCGSVDHAAHLAQHAETPPAGPEAVCQPSAHSLVRDLPWAVYKSWGLPEKTCRQFSKSYGRQILP